MTDGHNRQHPRRLREFAKSGWQRGSNPARQRSGELPAADVHCARRKLFSTSPAGGNWLFARWKGRRLEARRSFGKHLLIKAAKIFGATAMKVLF
jgi:hypothetical protein